MKASAEVSATRHTPGNWEGPWELVAAIGSTIKNIVKAHDSRLYPDNEQFTVAVVDPESALPIELIYCYAHLIAASPDLLAFVRKRYAETNCICGVKSKLKGTYLETDLECTKCVAEKLIAQAEGRSQ